MESITTEQTPAPELQLAEWWEQSELKGKEFCTLKKDGILVLNATEFFPERTITTLTADNADAATRALSEKFPEIENKHREIQEEWDGTEDKLKLFSKITRHKDYLLHTNAIGDFTIFFTPIAEWEKVMNALSDKNFEAKKTLVEKAEALVKEPTDWKATTQSLKEISDEWKAIGFSDKSRDDELWNRLEKARDSFFDNKRNFHDEQEKEMMRNLDVKMEIVDKAEKAAASDSWRGASEAFKQLMEQWKETGRITPEKNDELWKRFSEAQNVFYTRKRAHYEEISKEQEGNLAEKIELVERAESLKDSTDWNKTAKEFADIVIAWKKTGRVQPAKADELWKRLHDAQEHYFQNRRQHLETEKVTFEDNYAQKLALVNQAESHKDSTQWRETTDLMQELMEEWKKIGPVPREHNQSLWTQFLTARKHFFARKDESRDKRRQQMEKQVQHKIQHTKDFFKQLEIELREEEEKLKDFQEAEGNITPGPKEAELRNHLSSLIKETEEKIKHKSKKLDDARKQADNLTEKKPAKPARKNKEAKNETEVAVEETAPSETTATSAEPENEGTEKVTSEIENQPQEVNNSETAAVEETPVSNSDQTSDPEESRETESEV